MHFWANPAGDKPNTQNIREDNTAALALLRLSSFFFLPFSKFFSTLRVLAKKCTLKRRVQGSLAA